MRASSSKFLSTTYEALAYKTENLILLAEDKFVDEDTNLLLGGWLELAKEVNAEGILFHDNNPVIIFTKSESSDAKILNNIYNRVWCMGRPKFLFIALDSELRVYDLGEAPTIEDDWSTRKPLEVVTEIAEIAEKLKNFNFDRIVSGKIFEEDRIGRYGYKPDTTLLNDLKVARTSLLEKGLTIEYSHSLIGRSIFIRYLEDRGIITKSYFEEVAGSNSIWIEILNEPFSLNINSSTTNIYYPKVLTNKAFTYELFKRLAVDFNGDIFSDIGGEEEKVEVKHLDLLKNLLTSNLSEQQKIFLWAYDFKVIPIELISSVYEEFYHTATSRTDDKGTHYTPLALAEFVLSTILTKERLKKRVKVLDPACGSAIFLVEAFKRIVRFETYQKGSKLTAKELRNILQNQILGIEVNPEAIKVAAFSLYLALMHYQNPPDIIEQIKRGYHLPNLISKTNTTSDEYSFNILLCENSFEVDNSSNQDKNFTEGCADIVVGNPPWGSPSNLDIAGRKLMKPAISWCSANGYPVGDNERSQMFIWRSIKFLKEGGICGLLVSTGIFFKGHENSEKFRKKWLSEVKLLEVINFVHVRHIFFANPNAKKKAISPFAAVFFEKNARDFPQHSFKYWSARKTTKINALKVVILHKSDLRILNQSDVALDSSLWKLYWWGNHKDHALLNYFSTYPRLGDLADSDNNSLITKGQGYILGDKQKRKPTDITPKYPDIGDLGIQEKYGSLRIDNLKKGPSAVYRKGVEDVFWGDRILVNRGVGTKGIISRYETENLCFRHSIQGIKVTGFNNKDYKILLAILWSKVTSYYFWLTSSSWGIWHDAIDLKELLKLPVSFGVNETLKDKLIGIVDELRSEDIFKSAFFNNKIETLESALNNLVFDLYELSEAQRMLINDMHTYSIDYSHKNIKSNSICPVIQCTDYLSGTIDTLQAISSDNRCLENYIKTFLQSWQTQLPNQWELYWELVKYNSVPLVALVFTIQDINLPFQNSHVDRNDWLKVMEKLNSNLVIPYNSERIYADGLVRVVTEKHIIVIKSNERRLWSPSLAREDAEATILQAINLQSAKT